MADAPGSNMADRFMFGTFYPKHFIITVFTDPAQGQQAVEALHGVGFGADATWFLTGDQVLDADDAYLAEHRGRRRIGQLFPSEETAVQNEYLEEAKQGHAIVPVHTPEPAQQTEARDILRRHGGRSMRYYGDDTLVDL